MSVGDVPDWSTPISLVTSSGPLTDLPDWSLGVQAAPGSTVTFGGGFASFGDGSDGTVTFDGTTTIDGMVPAVNVYTFNRSYFFKECTINGGVTIVVNGYQLFVSDVLTNNGTIGWVGNNASGNTGGGQLINNASPYTTIRVGGAGGNGGTTGAGSQGTGNGNNGNLGGSGGNGGAGSGGAGGGGGPCNGPPPNTMPARFSPLCLLGQAITTGSFQPVQGGGGGGGGGGSAGGNGGGGGGGGGVVIVGAKTIAGTGTITTQGGAGAAGVAGNGGGGGGGGGGLTVVVSTTATAGAVSGQAISAAGGAGGAGVGSGSAGLTGVTGAAVVLSS